MRKKEVRSLPISPDPGRRKKEVHHNKIAGTGVLMPMGGARDGRSMG
jgi:hypothetical protein